MLKLDGEMLRLAEQLKGEQSLLVFGRGYNYATALEAALKVRAAFLTCAAQPCRQDTVLTAFCTIRCVRVMFYKLSRFTAFKLVVQMPAGKTMGMQGMQSNRNLHANIPLPQLRSGPAREL